ncbi:hypothetical protein QQ045_019648 [Rhodiola kirilowii]
MSHQQIKNFPVKPSWLEEKAKVSWLKEGDMNSSFFHASIKSRRAQNTIRLTMGDGTNSDDGDVVCLMASQYFEQLFGDFSAAGDINLGNLVQPLITIEDTDRLTSILDMEEINDIVFNMKSV